MKINCQPPLKIAWFSTFLLTWARMQSRKRSKCVHQCVQTMTSNGEESMFNSVSEFTRIKSHGMLKIASDNLFNLFARVENVVHDFLNKAGKNKNSYFYIHIFIIFYLLQAFLRFTMSLRQLSLTPKMHCFLKLDASIITVH